MNDLALTQPISRTFYTFRVHGRLYGLELAQIREVSTQVEHTLVPHAPGLVRGLANLRSRIYLVLDVGAALRGEPSQCTPDSRLIVLQGHVAESLALMVDHGGDIAAVASDQIEEALRPEAGESPADLKQSPVVELCKLEGELMMVIDPARIVAALENAIR